MKAELLKLIQLKGIAEIKDGKMIVLIDDDDRENEGDLVCAAEMSPSDCQLYGNSRSRINLFGISLRTKQLDLPLMVAHNQTEHGTNFTVTIEAAEEFLQEYLRLIGHTLS